MDKNENFISKIKLIFKEDYDNSRIVYKNLTTNVEFIRETYSIYKNKYKYLSKYKNSETKK